MKAKYPNFTILILAFFATTADSKADAEFTWVNKTNCPITVIFKDASMNVIFSTSAFGGAPVCLSGVATIEIADACGAIQIFDPCGNFISFSGVKCFCNPNIWVVHFSRDVCTPAGNLCGPGSTIINFSVY